MKKKYLLLLILGLCMIFFRLNNTVNAQITSLMFPGVNIGSIGQNVSDVVFRASGNEFLGSIFWLNTKSLNTSMDINIEELGEYKYCFKQIRGMYYNVQRGNRLRPLDEDTLNYFKQFSNSYNNLNMSGGLYTSCTDDEYSVYGQVSYSLSGGNSLGGITVGVEYNWSNNSFSGAFAKSLQRFDNKYPIGYIYDSRGGGIGFVGGGSGTGTVHNQLIIKINAGSGINNLFKYDINNDIILSAGGLSMGAISTARGGAINTLLNVGVQGTLGFGFSANTTDSRSVIGNVDRKTLIFNTLSVNFSKLINAVRRNAEELCKGNYQNGTSDPLFENKNIYCIDLSLGGALGNININETSTWTNLKNKILIIKNGDLRIGVGMLQNQGPVNIFVDKGNLLIENQTGSIIGFDGNGYAKSPGVSKGINLKGNFIINGLIIGSDTAGNKQSIEHKVFFNGKLASLNSPSLPSVGRTNQVATLFGTSVNNNWIRLGNVFKWECNPVTGTGNDNFTPCNNTGDRNASLPLVILDGYYPSRLIK